MFVRVVPSWPVGPATDNDQKVLRWFGGLFMHCDDLSGGFARGLGITVKTRAARHPQIIH